MKRTIIFLAALLISLAFASLYAAGLSDLAYDASGAAVIITDCDTESSGELVIPELIEGKLVTSIESSAFRDCNSLTGITIPGSVTSIGSSAFRDCGTLTSINIPDGVTSIGDNIFYGCTWLEEIMLPDGVTSIGVKAFYQCSRLTSVTMGDGVTSIGNSAFLECGNLASITIPDTVTSIGNRAFFECGSLVNITIPDSVTSIGAEAFYQCSSLIVITLPDGVTSVGGLTFYSCTGLTNVTMGDGVTSIGEFAFYGCTGLTDITIGDSVASIGEFSFYGCSGLKSITLPDSVTSIGAGAFQDCTDLTRIIFLGDSPLVGNTAFSVIPEGARAHVFSSNFTSFGGAGATWNGLIVHIDGSRFIAASAEKGSITFSGPDHYGGGYFAEGSEATLTAVPDTSDAFAGWRGDASGATNPHTLTVDGDKTIEAIFVNQSIYDDIVFQGQATVTADPESYGLVTLAAYDAMVAERDARPTLAEVADARVDSIVLPKDWQTGEVSLYFGLQKTDDFISWVAYGGGTLSDLGNGQFKVSLPLGPGKEWLRMVMKK